MARTLSPTLTAEMDGLDRTPASKITVERWTPEWTAKISGLTTGQMELYAHGHGAAVYADGNGAGEDILFRARSGSFTNPQDGRLYVAVIQGANLDDPSTWDGLWTDTGITGLMYPAWTANSGAAHGGSIAVAVWDNGGTPYGRAFYLTAAGNLCCVDVNLTTAAVGSPVVIAGLGTGIQLASMQVAASNYDEVFVLVPQVVEGSLAAWHKDVYGSFIRRYYFTTSWQTDNSFFFHTHAEGGLLRDTPAEGSDFGDASADRVTAQWGRRFCGGLAAHELDANTVAVSLGLTTWRRWGYYTHSQSVTTFIYHRDSGWWERGAEAQESAFSDSVRLEFDVFVRGCNVAGRKFLVWNRFVEPSDYEQTPTSLSIPRLEAVVLAQLSDDGRYLAEPHYLGPPEELTGATLVAVYHNGGKKLYALGWRSVYESPPAALVCTVDTPDDLSASCRGWSIHRTNRQSMTIDLDLADPTPLTAPDGILQSGALVRASYGLPGELVQVGQGFVDANSPALAVTPDGDFREGATVHCAADDLLLKTRAQAVEDVQPQRVDHIPAEEMPGRVLESRGVWNLDTMAWPALFFPGQYDALNGQGCYRLESFPPAQTGADFLQERYGSWFKDICWLEFPPMVDGMIEASVRFGDPYQQGNFNFLSNGDRFYAAISRTNGVITQIKWDVHVNEDYWIYNWNTAAQSAVMGGLLCHAAEVGRKYAFIWEYNSDFSVSSHTDDTWRNENFDRADYSAHGVGSNRLYLIVSDYDGANWVNKSVAGITATGLTPGKPADMRMLVQNGTIYCFYRPHSTGAPNQWRFAFSYKAGRFGAGQFGLVGRGHAGILWRLLSPGKEKIARTVNVVDFWDVKLSDTVPDRTLEEHLARTCWRGYTPARFASKVSDAGRTVTAGTYYSYGTPVENVALDFKLSIPASGNEAGVFVRGVSQASPTAECVKLGLVAHSTANTAGNPANYYLVKRVFNGGVEDASLREYAPLGVQLKPGQPVPVRVTVVGPVYSVWIAGNYAGHFIETRALGLYFGLYAEGGNATFSDVRLPELYEVTGEAALDANQAMVDAIRGLVGRRRIKAVFEYDGGLKFSYFETRDSGPAFTDDRLWQTALRKSPRFLSAVRVQGANQVYAIYQAASLAGRGTRFELVTNPEITSREFAYKEARLIVSETAERQVQADFEGLPDLRVEPEDEVDITIARQNVAGTFIVDDVEISVQMGDEPASTMRLSARQKAAV